LTAYTQSFASKEFKNIASAGDFAYRSQLWMVAADGRSAPRQLTFGDPTAGSPQWSPDGHHLVVGQQRQVVAERRRDPARPEHTPPHHVAHVPILAEGALHSDRRSRTRST